MYMKKLVGILLAILAVGGTALAAGKVIENGNQAAKSAIAQAGVENAYDVEAELDYEKGKPVYEVEFESNGREYDYDINAETGAVVKSEKETTTEDIGKEKAKEIALQHAGVAETETTRLRVERDYDDGRLEYQIEFRVGNKEYEYEVDAKTGNIHERDFDVENDRWDD